MTAAPGFYDDDLAYIHDTGFSGYAEGCAPGILHILRDAGIHDGRVVDLGCGGGVWASHLDTAGYQVWGADLSPALIARARQRVPDAEFYVASLWDHPLPRCRAVTALGEVFCYLADARAQHGLDQLFRKLYQALEPGGLLIFDVARIGLDRDRAASAIEGDDWACLVRYKYDTVLHRLTRHITAFRRTGALYRRSRERHVLQLYRRREVAEQLSAAGFEVRALRRFGNFPLLPKRIAFIARKKRDAAAQRAE